jgi:spore coat-associated protein N
VVAGSSAIFTSSWANPENTFTSGILSQSNSKDGSAILTADKMVPGQSANGTVEITDTGDVAGDFKVDSSNLTDTPGPNGGRLSTALQLKVEDITNATSPVSVYDGAYNAFPLKSLGRWNAGEKHTYRFTVTFPDSGVPPSSTTGDNAYVRSSTKIDFNWSATS